MKQITSLTLTLLLVFASCNTSRITSTWKPKDLQPRKFSKILVLGLVQEKDRVLREQMEHHLLSSLQPYGYNVVCACEEYDPKTFEGLTEKEALAKLADSGIDAVLTVVLLDKTKERYYIPGRIVYSPYARYRDHFWNYYITMYDRIYSPGYYASETKYFWESNLYAMQTKELLYSVQTHSFNPSSTESLAREYGQLIVKNIMKNNILQPQASAPRGF